MNPPAFTAPDVPSVVERIHIVRGRRVILDAELSALYGVSTKRFNEQVRRNMARFPADFAFRLSNQEVASLRSQNGDGSRFSVERMTVADHSRSQANEGGRPEQHGGWVRAGAAASEHFPDQPAHGFDRVGGPRQAETRVCSV